MGAGEGGKVEGKEEKMGEREKGKRRKRGKRRE